MKSEYKRMLVAIDIYAEYDQVINRALGIAASPNDIDLIFVRLPATYYEPYVSTISAGFLTEAHEEAKKRMSKICEEYNIPASQTHLPMGSIADEVHRVANDINAALIVTGTHGRSGLKLLLGSSATAILHGAKRDVLAVRVHSE